MSGGKELKYKRGDHWMACDLCGIIIRRSKIRRNWKNQYVCPEDFEEKHPQLLKQPIIRNEGVVKPVRPEQPDQFVSVSTPSYPIDPGFSSTFADDPSNDC